MQTEVRKDIAEELAKREGVELPADFCSSEPVSPELVSEADNWVVTMPMFNPAAPGYLLKRERPEHRVIIYLKCQGLTYREIARKVGWTGAGVSNVCRQPWAQKIILSEITKAGRDQVEAILNTEDVNSLMKLVELRDDPNVVAETQRKCATDILDRKYGRPNQPITHVEGDVRSMSDAELLAIARKAKSN